MGRSSGAAPRGLASASPRQLTRTTHLGIYGLMLGFLVTVVLLTACGSMRWTSMAGLSQTLWLPMRSLRGSWPCCPIGVLPRPLCPSRRRDDALFRRAMAAGRAPHAAVIPRPRAVRRCSLTKRPHHDGEPCLQRLLEPVSRTWPAGRSHSELPPQITRFWPVMAPASGPRRKATMAATSLGWM